jgi:hypothetical protein
MYQGIEEGKIFLQWMYCCLHFWLEIHVCFPKRKGLDSYSIILDNVLNKEDKLNVPQGIWFLYIFLVVN